MNTSPVEAQVLVRVSPRVLGDALCLALREQALDAVVCPVPERRRAPRVPRHFDVAVVNEALPRELVARSVVVLGEDGRPVRVLRRGDEEQVRGSGDLLDLLELVIDLASDTVQGAS